MLRQRFYNKLTAFIFSILFAEFAMGSFSGNDSASKDKFSLSNLGKISKNFSVSTFQTSHFRLLSSQDFFLTQNNAGLQLTSTMRLQSGNTTYVYPYKYVIRMPKFKTPTQH